MTALAELTRCRWSDCDRAAARDLAKAIERCSAGRARFTALVPGSDGRDIEARFDVAGARFVLVPGGTVEIGYDVTRFRPTARQRASYEDEPPRGLPPSIEGVVELMTTKRRRVTFPATLVEVQATEIGCQVLDPALPEVREVLAEAPPGAVTTEVSCGHSRLRVQRSKGGKVKAYRVEPVAHGEIMARLSDEGLAVLDFDAWEYVCGAGAATLFRWGDRCPTDRYPSDRSSAERPRRRRRAERQASRGEANRLAWARHLQPNAFGLSIASNPYEWEVVAAPWYRRGGDGGAFICGGHGFFLGWLPLATAWVSWAGESAAPTGQDIVTGAYLRRTMALL
jgi:hypothetical protein